MPTRMLLLRLSFVRFNAISKLYFPKKRDLKARQAKERYWKETDSSHPKPLQLVSHVSYTCVSILGQQKQPIDRVVLEYVCRSSWYIFSRNETKHWLLGEAGHEPSNFRSTVDALLGWTNMWRDHQRNGVLLAPVLG